MPRYTIKDIARMAGVSPTAISFVVNQKPGVSEETRDRIQKILEQTGFTPHSSSRRLVHQKTYNIAVLTQPSSSPFDDLFYSEVMKGLVKETQRHSYNLVFCPLNLDGEGQFQVPSILQHSDCDGVIVLQDIDPGFLRVLASYGPTIIVDNSEIITDVPYARVDNEKLMYLATEFVVKRGHRKIGVIGPSSLPAFYTHSFRGFTRALSDHNLYLHASWILDRATDTQAAYDEMEKALKNDELPSVYVCMSDRFAVGAMNSAKAHGLQVPADISFIGVDDIILSRYIDPPLTTIAIDKIKLGACAAGMLIECINGKEVRSLTLEMNQIIERQSVSIVR